MDSFFAFSLFCIRAPINQLECGPFWLIVSFIAFGAAATVVALLVQSHARWRRWRAWRMEHESHVSQDDQGLLDDPDFTKAVRDVVDPRAENRKP